MISNSTIEVTVSIPPKNNKKMGKITEIIILGKITTTTLPSMLIKIVALTIGMGTVMINETAVAEISSSSLVRRNCRKPATRDK